MEKNIMTTRYLMLICWIGMWIITWNVSVGQEISGSYSLSSWDEAWTLAMKNNPDLDIYRLQQEKADLAHKRAKNYRLPTISGSFSGQRNISLATTPLPGEIFGQPGETVDAQFGQEYNYNAGISVSKSIFNWQSKVQAKIAEMDIAMVGAQADAFEQSLKQQVAFYYYTALVAKEAINSSEKDLIIADSIYQLSQQRFNEGAVTQIAVNQAAINLNQVRQNHWANISLLEQCYEQLSILWGIPISTEFELTEKISIEPSDFPDFQELTPDLSLKVSEKQLQQAELMVKSRKAAFLPTLSVNGYFGQQQFRNDFGLSFGNGAWTDYSYVSLSLNIPLFSGFSNKHSLSESKIDLEIAKREYQNNQRNSTFQDEYMLSEYERSQAVLELTFDTFQLFDENSQLTFQTYSQGLVSLDNYLNTFEEYLKAEQAYLQALSDFYTQYANLITRQ